jgi:hypothetical protein
MTRLIVKCDELHYAGRTYRKGEEFDVEPADSQNATLLNAIGKTEYAPKQRQPVLKVKAETPTPAPQETEPPSVLSTPEIEGDDREPARPGRRYMRRDLTAED